MFFGLIYFPLRLFTSSAYTNTFNIGKPCQYLSKCVPTPPYDMNPDPNGARLGRGTCELDSGSDADIDMKWLTIFFSLCNYDCRSIYYDLLKAFWYKKER